jgi:hypothetical protein
MSHLSIALELAVGLSTTPARTFLRLSSFRACIYDYAYNFPHPGSWVHGFRGAILCSSTQNYTLSLLRSNGSQLFHHGLFRQRLQPLRGEKCSCR